MKFSISQNEQTQKIEEKNVIELEDGTKLNVSIGEQEGEPVFCVTDLLPHLAKDQASKPLKEAIQEMKKTYNSLQGKLNSSLDKIDLKTFADDIKKLVPYVFSHRIIIKNSMRIKNISSNFILEKILTELEAPVEEWDNKIGIK